MKHKVVILFAFDNPKKCRHSFRSFVMDNDEEGIPSTVFANSRRVLIGNTLYMFDYFESDRDSDKVCGLELSAVIFEDVLDIQLERYLLSRVRLRSFK